jgi:polygalacturonase
MKKSLSRIFPQVLLVALALVAGEAVAQINPSVMTAPPMPSEIEPVTAPFPLPQFARPRFPDKFFNIKDFGGKNDGKTKNTEAFRKAIEACSKSGGGYVVVPEGKWFTGAVHLKSNVNLHFEEGAEIHFSDDPNDYLPPVFTRWAGTELYNYSPLIYANNCVNIAITGPGKLFGHGEEWWSWLWQGEPTIKKIYEDQVLKNIPPDQRIYGTREAGLRPLFINPVNCKNVLFEGFTISSPGPFWTFDITYCENVIVRGLAIKTFGGVGTDGINLNSTRNALIEYCFIHAGDDGICLKSGINEDGWRVGRPTENVVIRNISDFKSHAGVAIGSDMSGDVRNVYVHDCQYLESIKGLRIKSNPSRGGIVENIWYENIKMENIFREAILIETNYISFMPSENGKAYPVFRNLSYKNITCNHADVAIKMQGSAQQPVNAVRFENIDIRARQGIISDWVNGLVMTNVNYQQADNPPAPADILFTRSHEPGIEAEYFNNKELQGEPVLSRVDKQVNFYWGNGSSPAPGVQSDPFSVRWKGFLKVPKSATYHIGMEADDGFRLYLDNKLLIDAWENYPKGMLKSVALRLEQDRFYDFRIEYFENKGFKYAIFHLKPAEM